MKNKILISCGEPYATYRKSLISLFWKYKAAAFRGREELFEPGHEPPVFKSWEQNVLTNSKLGDSYRTELYDLMPRGKPHKWMRSMTSSQALALSVFGNMKALEKMECLEDIKGEDGLPLFTRSQDNIHRIEFEKDIDYLGEPRKTNVDIYFGGYYQIAVECKLSEPEIGACSRSRLRPSNSNYNQDYCDGRYVVQRGRKERCALTERGIRYWEHIQGMFKEEQWKINKNHDPCPLNNTYQLVRNVLAARLRAIRCDKGDVTAERANGHCVLLYDERNPAFMEGGRGRIAYNAVRSGLIKPSHLQECTWQQVMKAMAKEIELQWLIDGLHEKYGL